MYRILVLMSHTGWGHYAVAEALKAEFARQFGRQFQVDIIDLLTDHLPWPIREAPKSYFFVANRVPWLLKLLWKAFDRSLLFTVVAKWAREPVGRAFERYKPDLIISVHPLVQDISLSTLKQLGLQIPYVTIVTDMITAHSPWFHPDVHLCFVASRQAYTQALRAGVRPTQLRQYGLPIRPEFSHEPPSKEQLRQQLGIPPDLPAILLVGGGDGVGPIAKIARNVTDLLDASGRPAGQLVAVCGHNQRLQNKLATCEWRVPTTVLGFADNISDWMAACDCIITKAGSVTIAEALVRGLPIVLSGYLPSQEDGNVHLVVQSGVGVYCQDPTEIASIVNRWLGPERSKLDQMAERARRIGYPQATSQTAREIAGILEPGTARTAQGGQFAS